MSYLAVEKGSFYLIQGCCTAASHGDAHEPLGCAELAASDWEIQVEVDNTVENRAVAGINLGSGGLVAPVCNKSQSSVSLQNCGFG